MQTNQNGETIDDSSIMNDNRIDGTEKSRRASTSTCTNTTIDIRKIYAHESSEKELSNGHGWLTQDEQTKWTMPNQMNGAQIYCDLIFIHI